MQLDLSPPGLMAAYASGIFPMADDTGTVRWLAPDPRAVLELEEFRVSRTLRGVVRRGLYDVRINTAFREMVAACADRVNGTWISPEIEAAYLELHRLGFAHSVESWFEDQLAGGLYGVALGGAFFGESMFHRRPDASKVALVHLVERLKSRGFVLLDCQFLTEHLQRFGAREIPRAQYQRRLRKAIRLRCTFADQPTEGTPFPEVRFA